MKPFVFATAEPEVRSAASMPAPGRILARPAPPDGVRYFLYMPARRSTSARPIVLVHGISRNADDYMAAFAPLAERSGRLLIAPVFDERTCRKYQKVRAGGLRADRMLLAVLKDVARVTRAKTDKIGLFGFSGGAQFAHRFAMLHPGRVARLVLSSAGWYTFPTDGERFPYGIRSKSDAIGRFGKRLDRFLAIPTLVLVGEFDTARDARLRKERVIDSQQGRTRVERAARWAGAVRDAAEQRGIAARIAFQILTGCGHEFGECASKAGLAQRAIEWLLADDLWPLDGATTAIGRPAFPLMSR